MNKAKVRERIYINKNELDSIELDILNRRHIERYAMIRQWCYGEVADISCGCGYGTYLVSKNPDVKNIIGVDIDKNAIKWCNKYYKTEKCTFEVNKIENFNSKKDVLICIETIEHLKNPNIINDLAERCNINTIFISYPSKKTTHYNKYHYHDFIDEDLIRIFKNYRIADVIDLHREVRILKFIRNV